MCCSISDAVGSTPLCTLDTAHRIDALVIRNNHAGIVVELTYPTVGYQTLFAAVGADADVAAGVRKWTMVTTLPKNLGGYNATVCVGSSDTSNCWL